MLKRSIITTADGSTTIHIADWNEQYHSKHGAIQEAKHVFIDAGLHTFLGRYPKTTQLSILEIGFGTGLNALLTLNEAQLCPIKVNYHGVEAYPVKEDELLSLNYSNIIPNSQRDFDVIHDCKWDTAFNIHPNFQLKKRLQLFSDITDRDAFDIIYFDAFGPRVQPQLWTPEVFKVMHTALKMGGLLVTYSAKGSVRRAMSAVGFQVERLPGPPGKREMLRATKQ